MQPFPGALRGKKGQAEDLGRAVKYAPPRFAPVQLLLDVDYQHAGVSRAFVRTYVLNARRHVYSPSGRPSVERR